MSRRTRRARRAAGSQPSRLERVLRAILGIVVMLSALTLSWVGAHFATTWLFARWGLEPGPLVRQLATSLGGLALMAVPGGLLGLIHRPREVALWRAVTSAFGRIAQGDFGVRVEAPWIERGQHPISRLVHEINDMAEALDRMERLRQEFISNVSHEIGSPLTSIRGFAQALHDERLSPQERRRYLEIIELESERLAKLSDNLLKLTALEAEQPPIEKRSYRLDAQLQRVILSCEPQWSGKGLELEAELAPVSIVGDEALLDHVWLNLLHNAVKFTPDGGNITVRLVDDAGAALVTIADTGVGISAADQERIFERFFKADRARNRAAGGSGLGLALAKRIVTLHGGEIRVTSEPGRGSTFAVRLPSSAPAK